MDKNIDEMTDREILVEILTILRMGVKAVEDLSSHPMLASMGMGGMPSPMDALAARRQ